MTLDRVSSECALVSMLERNYFFFSVNGNDRVGYSVSFAQDFEVLNERSAIVFAEE